MLILIFTFNSWAQVELNSFGPALGKYKYLYKNAQYESALEALDSVDFKLLPAGEKAYLVALTFSKIQKYDDAIANFKIAIKLNNKQADLYYEYGQALYGNNNLRAARDCFMKSASSKFNYTASVYYVAYISEILEEYQKAKSYYGKLIKDPNTDKKTLQVSIFQFSKILLNIMRKQEITLIELEKNITKNIPKYIFPILNKALEVDRDSELAIEITQLIQALTSEFNLDPNIMVNGRRIAPSRVNAYFSLRAKTDDNVALSKQYSALLESEGYYKYDFVFNKRVIVAPDIRLNFTKYKNQNEPQVYMNDSFTITTDLKNRFEHKIGNRPASFLIDLDFSRQYKDWQGLHKKEYFYQSYGQSIGEQFNYFNSGETTIQVKNSNYKDITNSLNNIKSLAVTLDQYFFLNQGQHLLIATLEAGSADNYNYNLLNTNSYSLRLLYLVFEILPACTLQMGATATFTDTKLQRDSRGNEITFNPSIDLTKKLSESFKLSFNYNYIKNNSRSDLYFYKRQILGMDLNYNFK
jgi:hypothetical protein